MSEYADLSTIRTDEPTPTVLALCDAVEWMRDRLTELGDAPSMERFHPREAALYLYRVVTRHGRLVVSAEVGGLVSAQRVVDDLDVTFWNDGPHRIERRRYTEWEPVPAPTESGSTQP